MPDELFTIYSHLLPPLTTDEREALAASLKADGQRDPIVIDEKGNILDGHHRAEILKHPKTRVISGLTEAEKQAFVFQANLARRNLSPEQKREVLKTMKQVAFALRKEDAKKNTQAVVAAMLGVARSTVESWFAPNDRDVKGRNSAPDARVRVPKTGRLVIVERVDAGETQEQIAADFGVTRQQVSKIAIQEKTKQETRKKNAVYEANDANGKVPYRLILSSIEDLHTHVEKETVDCIITDPPYAEEFLPLWSDLSTLAAHVLKPGGSLLAMAGQFHLFTVGARLATALRYHWTLAYLTPGGQSPQIWPRKINTFWKPILWFTKGEYEGKWHGDVLKSEVNDNDKRFHDWGQSTSGMRELVEKFTDPGSVILDPFLGGGTTGVIALALERRFIGAEKDEATFQIAHGRIQENYHEQQ